MCNRNKAIFMKAIPWYVWLLMVICVTVKISLVGYGISTAINYEADETESSTKYEKKKESFSDIDFHMEKHQAKLEHEQELAKMKEQHETVRVGIIVPCVLLMIVVIAGTSYAVFIRKNSTNTAAAASNLPKGQNYEMKKCIRIPENRVTDFNQLIMMGYGRRETANAITNSGNIGSALDYLNRKPNETNNVPRNDILANQDQTTSYDTSGENGMVPIWV